MTSKKSLTATPVACAMSLKVTYITTANGTGGVSKHSDTKRDALAFYTHKRNKAVASDFKGHLRKDVGEYYYSAMLESYLPGTEMRNKIGEVRYKLMDLFQKTSITLEFQLDSLESRVVYNTLPGVYHKAIVRSNKGRVSLVVAIAIDRNHLYPEMWAGNLSQRYSIVAKNKNAQKSEDLTATQVVSCALKGCNLPSTESCNCGKAFYCSSKHRGLDLKEAHRSSCSFYG